MTPVLAQGSVLAWDSTRALTVTSPVTGCEAKWNWSEVPQMSPPPPCTVQVPPVTVWPPAGVAPPTSAQVQPPGQLMVEPAVTATLSKVTVLPAAVLCEVTARPASIDPLTLIDIAEPPSAVQVAPSIDVKAVNVLPERPTRTNAGAD